MKHTFKKFILFMYLAVFQGQQVFADSSFDDMAKKMSSAFDAPLIYSKDLSKLIDSKDVLILDTREPAEYNVSHIKGAVHVGYDDIEIESVTKLAQGKKKVITYCSVGYRSGDVAEKLKSKGVNAFNLYGGIFNWVNEDRPVYKSANKKTEDIHGYSKKWGKWLKKGNIVY